MNSSETSYLDVFKVVLAGAGEWHTVVRRLVLGLLASVLLSVGHHGAALRVRLPETKVGEVLARKRRFVQGAGRVVQVAVLADSLCQGEARGGEEYAVLFQLATHAKVL